MGGPVADRHDRARDEQGPVRRYSGGGDRALAVHGHGGHRRAIAGRAVSFMGVVVVGGGGGGCGGVGLLSHPLFWGHKIFINIPKFLQSHSKI